MPRQSLPYKPGWHDRSHEKFKLANYGYFRKFLKILLYLSGAGVIISIVLWPQIRHNFDHVKHGDIDHKLIADPKIQNIVFNPKFESLDRKGRPFRILAEQAIQNEKNRVALIRPEGNLLLEDGTRLQFKADTGTYHQEDQILYLKNHVNLKLDSGYDLYSNSAVIDITNNRGQGKEPVWGTGPSHEEIQAEGFQITNRGDLVNFSGRSSVQLPMNQSNGK